MEGRSVAGTPVVANEDGGVGWWVGPPVGRRVARGAGRGGAAGRRVAASGVERGPVSLGWPGNWLPPTISGGTRVTAVSVGVGTGTAVVEDDIADSLAPAVVQPASSRTRSSAVTAMTVEVRLEFDGVMCG
jgi:hypothetical protein